MGTEYPGIEYMKTAMIRESEDERSVLRKRRSLIFAQVRLCELAHKNSRVTCTQELARVIF